MGTELILIILGIWLLLKFYSAEIILIIVGIASFLIPLVLSLRNNSATKLNKGEVRRALVISLTVMYIILLSQSFAGTGYLPSSNVTSVNKTLSNSTSNMMVCDTVKNDTCNNQTIVNSTVTITNYEIVTTTSAPISADIIKNFLYVYVIIIGFYFGSRLTERIQTTKAYKNLKPLDILQKRYAMGEIDRKVFDETEPAIRRLEEEEKSRENTANNEKKKEIEYQKEVELLQDLVRKQIISSGDYSTKREELKNKYGYNSS